MHPSDPVLPPDTAQLCPPLLHRLPLALQALLEHLFQFVKVLHIPLQRVERVLYNGFSTEIHLFLEAKNRSLVHQLTRANVFDFVGELEIFDGNCLRGFFKIPNVLFSRLNKIIFN